MNKGLRKLKNQNIFELGSLLLIFLLFSSIVFAQKTVVTPKPNPKPFPQTPKVEPPDPPDVVWNDDIPFEKTIQVDEGVLINLCISEGNVKINGWERDELRVFINQGSKAGFKVHNKNRDNKPSRLTILGYDPTKSKGKDESQWLSGDQIELDVPMRTNLSSLTGVEGDVTVSIQSISKAIVKINEGNINLRDISEKISAKTFDGNIFVEDSKGDIDLDTTNGSVLGYNLEPIEVDDALKAKTNNGSVLLQSATHSVIEVSSITGTIKFSGEIQTDGQYTFRNTNGQILLEMPENSSCVLEVLSEMNKFQHNNFKFVTYNISNAGSTMQMVRAQLGKGDATISLQNQSGKIVLLKKK